MTTSETKKLLSQIVNPGLNAEEQKIITASKIQLLEGSEGHLSPSQIELYLNVCSRQYWYKYNKIRDDKLPSNVPCEEGTSHHETFEYNNKYKIRTGKDRSVKAMENFFYDAFNTNSKQISKEQWKLSGEKKDTVIRRGIMLQRRYCRDFAPYFQPELAEHEIRFNVGKVEVLGFLDAMGVVNFGKKKQSVIDYKVVKRKKSDYDLVNGIGLSFYGWGVVSLVKDLNLSKNPPYVGYLCLLKTGKPRIVWQPILLQIDRIKRFRSIVLSVANSISKGDFPKCKASHWCCNPRFCEFFGQCRGK